MSPNKADPTPVEMCAFMRRLFSERDFFDALCISVQEYEKARCLYVVFGGTDDNGFRESLDGLIDPAQTARCGREWGGSRIPRREYPVQGIISETLARVR